MTVKTFKMGLLAAAGLFFMVGCANTAHIEKSAATDLSKYKTYSWVEAEKMPDTKENRRKQIAQQNVKAAVDKQLQKSGWQLSDRKPDVLVSTDLVVEKSRKEQQDPMYSRPYSRSYVNRYTGRLNTFYFPSQFVGYNSYSTTVKEGTVTVTLIDAKTDQAVWQGWATNQINNNLLSDKDIDRNVKSIFKKFDTNN